MKAQAQINSPKLAASALLVLGLIASTPAAALDGVDVLKTPVTARAMSLGGLSALSNGGEAVFYNPAGMATAQRNALTLTHTQLTQGTRLDALGLAVPVSESVGSLGMSLLALTQDGIGGRDAQRNPTGSLQASDMVLGLSWANSFSVGEGRVHGGVTAKYIRQALADASASGQAVDLGLQGSGFGFARGLLMGLSIQNLGPKMKFEQESFNLPLAVSAGAAMVFNDTFVVQLGGNHRPHGERTTVGIGAELAVGQGFTLRSGFTYAVRQARTSPFSGANSVLANLALGVGWKPGKSGLRLDYALVPGSQDLGSAHRFTIGVEFGGGAKKVGRKAQRSGNEMTALEAKRHANYWDKYWDNYYNFVKLAD